MKTFTVVVLPGDGIGVEVTESAIAVIEAARSRAGGYGIEYQYLEAGAAYFKETGKDIVAGAEEAEAH